MYKTVQIVGDTKKIIAGMKDEDLKELRAMQQPPTEVQELLEVIIIIRKTKFAYNLVYPVDLFHQTSLYHLFVSDVKILVIALMTSKHQCTALT